VHLREIAIAILSLAAGDPFRSWPGNAVPVAIVTVIVLRMIAVAGITLGGRHDLSPLQDSSKLYAPK
jgi:hypothetical protein